MYGEDKVKGSYIGMQWFQSHLFLVHGCTELLLLLAGSVLGVQRYSLPCILSHHTHLENLSLAEAELVLGCGAEVKLSGGFHGEVGGREEETRDG